MTSASARECREAAKLAREVFGVDGRAERLPGEFDLNFRIRRSRGAAHSGRERRAGRSRDFVLKVSPRRRRDALDLALASLRHLEGRALSAAVPRIVRPGPRRRDAAGTMAAGPGDAAGAMAEVDFGGSACVAAVVSWVRGRPLADVRPRSPAVLEALGALLCEIGQGLRGFDHPALERDFPWRMESAPATIATHLDDVADPALRRLVRVTLARAEGILGPVRDELPVCAIHGDANDYNVMVEPTPHGPRLSGLIDFGDVTRGWRAAEVAVAAAYAMMGLPDPVDAACAIAGGLAAAAARELPGGRDPVGERREASSRGPAGPLSGDGDAGPGRFGSAECRAVLPLAAQRLCLSVCVQAREMARQPDNDYLAVSQEGARALLDDLAAMDWRIAEFRIRDACGLPPNPAARQVVAWMAEVAGGVMDADRLARPLVLDLSAGSLDLPLRFPRPGRAGADPSRAAQDAFDRWIEDALAAVGATVGVGRYGEARMVYDAPGFRAEGNDGDEARTIHLGVDLFAPAGAPVRTPLPGTVASVADNAAPLDYGPTVILHHHTPCGTGFHTLYGHLDRATLEGLAPGGRVAAGQVIGRLGDRRINGGWPPHLHFQVIALDPLVDPLAHPARAPGDTADNAPGGFPDNVPDNAPGDIHDNAPGDFPGVALQRLRTVWESILPDPSPLTGLDAATATAVAPHAQPVLRKRDLATRRKTVLSSSLSLSYDDPIHMVRGLGARLYDDAGRAYLDTVNNVPHVGHGNPRVADAIARQSRTLNTNTRYLHSEIVGLADELLAHFPAPLEVVFLVCSGSEANELALRMARCHTGREGVACVEGAYHGNTGGLVEVSPYKFDGPGGGGASDRVAVAAMPDAYRGRFRGNGGHGVPAGRRDPSDGGPAREAAPAVGTLGALPSDSAPATADLGALPSDDAPAADLGALCAADVARAADALASGPHGLAAFIVEPILSCGGQIEPPPGYLSAAFAHVRRRGGVCIADEVQVGFGRVGDAFWGFELQDVTPDIVTLGKPMGNGHPVAAVVTTRAIADSFANGMEYFSTFGGNPVSCAAARAVLAEIAEMGLQEHARTVGERLLAGLGDLATRHEVVGDVRGRGLFLGVELVRDRAGREPFPEACGYLVNRARERGVLLSADGPDHNVIKIKPPMVFGEGDARLLLQTLDAVLGESAIRG